MSDYTVKRGLKPFYMGLPIKVLRRIGETCREGFYKYDSSPWDRYYQKELSPEDFLEIYNNAVEHLFNSYDEIVNGTIIDGEEDHLAHAVVNLCMIMWATESGKLPNKRISMIEYFQSEIEKEEEENSVPSIEDTLPEVNALAEPVKRNILDILKIKKASN